jgi:hypothetical protein
MKSINNNCTNYTTSSNNHAQRHIPTSSATHTLLTKETNVVPYSKGANTHIASFSTHCNILPIAQLGSSAWRA